MRCLLYLMMIMPMLLSAQDDTLRATLSFGLGAPIWFGGSPSDIYDNPAYVVSESVGLPVSFGLKADFPVAKYVSLGMTFNYLRYCLHYYSYRSGVKEYDRQSIGTLNFNARINLTIPFENHWVFYGGYGTGRSILNYREYGCDTQKFFPVYRSLLLNVGHWNMELSAGCRYFPFASNRNLGLFAEVGLGQSWLQGGLTYKILRGTSKKNNR